MKVYVITACGNVEYQNSVVGVTSDRQEAEAFARKHTRDRHIYTVVEYDTDFIKKIGDKKQYYVWYDDMAKVFSASENMDDFIDRGRSVYKGYGNLYWTYVFAKNEGSALKIGEERIIPAILRNEMLDGRDD